MKVTENYCNGCPECIHCGRNADVEVLQCDECGAYEDELFIYDGEELCIDCIKKRLERVTIDD